MSPEIKKRRIVLASVLKPVDETRMLEKIGATLSNNDEYEVFIIGYPTTSSALSISGITQLPLPTFKRISFKRLLIPWIIFRKINQVKPEVIIINTPEILIVTILSKILFGRKIIYDVLENYFRNVRHTQTFPIVVRPLLAGLTRLVELISAPFIRYFFLAEKGYVKELSFAKPSIILENKVPKKIAQKFTRKRSGYSRLLFTGTLAPTTGIFDTIRLAKKLHALDPAYTLTIVGYCPIPEVLRKIEREIEALSYIKIVGGAQLVPHPMILTEISQADVGIIIYPHNVSTESSIPTKLYEYLALKLPIIIRHTEQAHELVTRCNGGIVLSEVINFQALDNHLKTSRVEIDIPEEIYWEHDGELLSRTIKSILKPLK